MQMGLQIADYHCLLAYRKAVMHCDKGAKVTHGIGIPLRSCTRASDVFIVQVVQQIETDVTAFDQQRR